jgi:hypothetical protein
MRVTRNRKRWRVTSVTHAEDLPLALPFQGTQFVANVAWIPVHARVLVDFLFVHRQKQPLRLPA